MKYITILNESVNIDLFSSSINLIAHICNYLNPQYNLSNSGKWKIYAKQCTSVTFNKSAVKYWDDYILEYGDKGKSKFTNEIREIYNERTGSYMEVNYNLNKINIFNPDFKGLFIDTYKTIRQILMFSLINSGFLLLHASSFEIGGQATIFMGDKGVGKSSLVASCLSKYGRLASLLGNDRIFCKTSGDIIQLSASHTVIGLGAGMIIDNNKFKDSISNKTHQKAGSTSKYLLDQPNFNDAQKILTRVKNLSAKERWHYTKEKIWITPPELSIITNCKIGNEAALNTIVLPKIDNDSRPEILQIDKFNYDKIFNQNILDFGELYPNWLNLSIKKPKLFDQETLRDAIWDECTVIRVIGNDMTQIINLLDPFIRNTQ